MADVTLPPLISDNMLLQRSGAAVWGKADPGEAVTVKLGAIPPNRPAATPTSASTATPAPAATAAPSPKAP